jgi:hypothetical protein
MRFTTVSSKMNIVSLSPSLTFVLVFSVVVDSVCVGSADRRLPSTGNLIVSAYQRTKSISTQTPKVGSATLPTNWHDLVPLHSTRADAERVLGKPKESRYSTSIYDTAHDRIDVLYSEGPCKTSEVERWNVSKDVIIRIDVRPKHSVPVNTLRLDSNRYVKTRESHPNNWFTYWNKDDGITVETIKSGRVEEVNSITYGPKAKDYSLRCAPD